MSWQSSAEYYRLINEETQARLGGLRSADCILRSVASLVGQADSAVPLFDTTRLHARRAVELALQEGPTRP